MSPKKRVESPSEVQDLGAPSEEEEEGPGKVAFSFSVSRATDLPCELETRVRIGGPFRDTLSQPATASRVPCDWQFPRSKFVRTCDQALYNDIAGKKLSISLLDVAAEGAVIGSVALDLTPLLHDQLEVGGDLELKLAETYYAKWFLDPEVTADGSSPPPVSPPPDGWPVTKMFVSVSVPELVGPPEDRESWLIASFGVRGLFALPERMTSLGVGTLDDLETHQLKYSADLLGEHISNGVLTPPVEPPPPEEGVEEGLPEDEWRAQRERQGFSIRFPDGEQLVRYCGASFIREFRYMLIHVGGAWFYFTPEEKPSTDPKKPNLPEAEPLSRHYCGKAWFDLRALIRPGVHAVANAAPLRSTCHVDEAATEPTLEMSHSFARLALELSRDVMPPETPGKVVPLSQILSPHDAFNKFAPSEEAAEAFVQAAQRTIELICVGNKEVVQEANSVQGVVEGLRKAGVYSDARRDLRDAIVCVFRERLRKDTGVVPGKPMTIEARENFFSDLYSHLKSTTADVLDDMRGKSLEFPVAFATDPAEDPLAPPAERPSSTDASPKSRTSQHTVASAPGGEVLRDLSEGPEDNTVAAALAESAASRAAREALCASSDKVERCNRLVYEAEMVHNWDRAAETFQTRLVLVGPNGKPGSSDPAVWVEYAKFCMRARGRQAAAEEALKQAVRLLADQPHTREMAIEVDLMLACILLDRGRHEEAIAVFREWHVKDLPDATFGFFLGLALFLVGEAEQAAPLLEAVARPRAWFGGLADDFAVADKLRMSLKDVPDQSVDTAPYVACLERLLDFGLPGLAFTFLDQCGTLTEEALATEPITLIDARAAALDRDFASAVSRLEPLLAGADASQEAWRLAGECYVQLQDFDKALQALQYALSFERKFEDPAVYIALGHVLMAKKRWKQARDAFLRSIHYRPTAEAWSGVAYAEYRGEELQNCYEALREASLLDNSRSDVWAQLALVHLRFENWELAEQCFRRCADCKPDSDELLLEIAVECTRREKLPQIAEAVARLALQIRDSGQGHAALADAFSRQGQTEKAVLEAQVAVRLLPDQPDQRKAIFERALKWAEDLDDLTLTEALHVAMKFAAQQEAARPSSSKA